MLGLPEINWSQNDSQSRDHFLYRIQYYCKLTTLGLLIGVGTNLRLTKGNCDGQGRHAKMPRAFFSCLHQLGTIGFDYISRFLHQVRVSETSLCGLVELIPHILFSDDVLSFLYLSPRSINPLGARLSYPEVSIYMSSSRDSEIKLFLLSCSTLMPIDSLVH